MIWCKLWVNTRAFGQHRKLLEFGIHLNNIGLFWHHIRMRINWKWNQINVLEMKFSVVYRTCSKLIQKITGEKRMKILQIKTWSFMSIFWSSWVSGGWFIWKLNGSFFYLSLFISNEPMVCGWKMLFTIAQVIQIKLSYLFTKSVDSKISRKLGDDV